MSVLWIYGLITVIPGLLLFLMLALGADQDMDADVDVDADVDFDADMDVDAGDFAGPGILGVKLILCFLVGLGLSGFLSASFKWPPHHILYAIVGGFIFWFLAYHVLKWLYSQQSTSQISVSSLVGKPGTVTVPIPEGGVGEVEAAIGDTGRTHHLSARAEDGTKAYKRGDTVTIKAVIGSTATVQQDL